MHLKTWQAITGTIVILFLGIGAGAAGTSGAEPAPKPKVKTVTHTVTETQTVEVTPQSCLDALNRSDRAMGMAGNAFGVTAEILDAVLEMDVAKMTTQTGRLGGIRDRLGPVMRNYRTAAADCRAAQ